VPTTVAFDRYDRRPSLVLLHAFPFDRRMWRRSGEVLASRARVLAPDLPGFGGSADLEVAADLDAWADLIDGWLESMVGTQPVVLCGVSMGGYVALRLVARHPRRPCALVLADTRAGADDAAARAGREQAIERVMREGLAPLVDSLLPRLLAPTADPAVVAAARELMLEQRPEGVAAALAAMRDRPDSTAMLSRVRVPTLVIVGVEDLVTPPQVAAEMAAALPAGRLHVIPDAGHLSCLEAPEEFNRAVAGLLETVAAG
jgi:3-oxoadipate enol-lactonase